ncbi:hypothetical protein AB0B50_24980 [Streptomyces sp. NPDC041068]|uniref:hypothetical protein n=1 Tax=Streptomyces sp. NPDC041068 TaxID=3155130 RepID=UPI0033D61168
MTSVSVGGLVACAVRRARGALDTVTGAADALTRVLIGAVLDRIDLDALVSRVDAERIAERIDVNRIAERVDVNRVADRVDVDAVIARIDLVGLTRDVLNEIDLGRIVRDTGGGMTADTVDGIRLLGQRGDRSVNRFADRLLRRAAAAQDDGAGPPERGPR